MSQEKQTLSFQQVVKASPKQIYQAFTNATILNEWLSDGATVAPHPGGRILLWWNSGYYTAGEYLELIPDEKIAFTWLGRGEPAQTRVHVSLQAQAGSTQVRLEHSEIGTGPEWEQPCKEINKGWESGLENLASLLETGKDLRFVRRPMLGVLVSDFSPEIAKSLDVPVTEGIRIDGTVDGMGAQAAGLQRDDVIVGMAGQPVIDWASLTSALQSHRAGDTIEVVYYRGSEKQTTDMTLSGRPIPDVPETPAELAQIVQGIYADVDKGLEQIFAGVSEVSAGYRPAPGEWSAKEILAHLIIVERGTGTWVSELIGAQLRWSDDYAGNSHEQTRAIVAARPTVADLLAELKRCEAENVAFLASLPDEFVARKGTYWRVAYNLIQTPYHGETHFDQIRAAVASAPNP